MDADEVVKHLVQGDRIGVVFKLLAECVCEPRKIKLTHYRRLTLEQTMNYVLFSFRENTMFRAVVEEAAALASLSLFLGMIAVWAQVLGTF